MTSVYYSKGERVTVEQEFKLNYPDCVYLGHKNICADKIAVSYVKVNPIRITKGIKEFEIKDGRIKWWCPVDTFIETQEIRQRG